jgi:hypothetical protein
MKGEVMAGYGEKIELLFKADCVFRMAGELASAFNVDVRSGIDFDDPTVWQRHAPNFDAFCQAIVDLSDLIQNPIEDFLAVADVLKKAASIAHKIKQILDRNERWGMTFAYYPAFLTDLVKVSHDGCYAVEETKLKWGVIDSDLLGELGQTTKSDGSKWLTVTEAATASGATKSEITKAANCGALISNGQVRHKRRISKTSVMDWQLQRATKPERIETDAAIQRKLNRMGHN